MAGFLRNPLCFLESQPLRLLYPMGRTLAFRDVSNDDKTEQKLSCVKIDEQLDCITAITLCYQCLALACKFLNDKSAYILFYDLTQGFRKLTKIIHDGSPSDTEDRYFISISISSNSIYMAALTNLKMSTAKVYEIKKDPRLISACSWFDELKKIDRAERFTEINKITMDPNDKDQVCMSGKNHLRLWRNFAGILRPNPPLLNIDTHDNFVDHLWVNNSLVAAITDSGNIFFILNNKQCILQAKAFDTAIDSPNCLALYPQGIMVGGDTGLLSLWNKTDNSDEKFTHFKNIKIDNHGKIAALCIKSNLLAIGYRSNYISLIDLGELINPNYDKFERIIIDDGYHIGQIQDEDNINYSYFPSMDMDMAIHRPLVATCCKNDSSIRIWNYSAFKCDLIHDLIIKQFTDVPDATSPLSVSFHPSGYLLAGGFTNQAMIWHVLEDEVRQIGRASCRERVYDAV